MNQQFITEIQQIFQGYYALLEVQNNFTLNNSNLKITVPQWYEILECLKDRYKAYHPELIATHFIPNNKSENIIGGYVSILASKRLYNDIYEFSFKNFYISIILKKWKDGELIFKDPYAPVLLEIIVNYRNRDCILSKVWMNYLFGILARPNSQLETNLDVEEIVITGRNMMQQIEKDLRRNVLYVDSDTVFLHCHDKNLQEIEEYYKTLPYDFFYDKHNYAMFVDKKKYLLLENLNGIKSRGLIRQLGIIK
jgi:hypothetical protein